MSIMRRCAYVLEIVIAVILVVIAIITVSLRVSPWQIDSDSSVLRWLPLPSSVKVELTSMRLELSGPELELSTDNLSVSNATQDGPQQRYTVKHAQLALNLRRSFALRQPAFDSLVLEQPNVRLDQADNGLWFPKGDDNGSFSLNLPLIERWLENLAGSRATITQGSIDLYGLYEHHRVDLNQAILADDTHGNTALQVKATMVGASQPGATLNAQLSPQHDTTGKAELFGDASQIMAITSMFTSPLHYQLDSSGNLHAQLQWQGFDQADARVAINLPTLHIDRTIDQQDPLNLRDVSLKTRVSYNHGAWTGAIADLGAKDTNGKALDLPAHASIRGHDRQVDFMLPTFKLDPANLFWGVMPFSDHLREMYVGIHPRGTVKAATISLNMNEGVEPRQRVRILADVQNASIQPHDESPGISPVSGWVDTTFLKGTAQLIGQQTTLSLPRVFAQPWQLKQMKGRLSWITRHGYVQLDGQDLTMTRDRLGEVQGNLSLILDDAKRKKFSLGVKLNNGHLNNPLEWVPVKTLSPSLSKWLTENVHHADVPSGSLDMLMVFGAPQGHPEEEKKVNFEDPNSPSHLKLNLNVKNGRLGYMDGWPPLDQVAGTIALNGADIRGNITHADIKGLTTNHGTLSFHDHVLTADAPSIKGDASGLLNVLQHARFEDQSLHTQFNQWSAKGSLVGQMHLSMPFEGKDEHQAHLTASGHVTNGQAVQVLHHLTISDISSHGHFEMNHGKIHLTGQGNGQVFDGPVHATSDLNAGVGGLHFSGQANAKSAMQWLGVEGLVPDVSGNTGYTGSALIHKAGGSVNLSLQSNLENVDVPLPSPLGKSADESVPLKLAMDLTNGIGSASIQNRLFVRWRDQMEQGQIWVQQWPKHLTWQNDNGWVLNWHAPEINPMLWHQAVAGLEVNHIGNQANRKSSSFVFNGAHFTTECLMVNGRCLGSLDLIGYKSNNDWFGRVSGPLISGHASYRPEQKTPVLVTLDHISIDPALDMLPSKKEGTSTQPTGNLYNDVFTLHAPSTPLMAFPKAMASVPDGKLDIKDIQARNTHGYLNLDWHANSGALKVQNIKGELADARLNGNISWSRAGDASVTTGSAEVYHRDFGRILDLLNQPNVVTTPGGGNIHANFSWPGAPWQPDWQSVTATIRGHVNHGTFASLDSNSARLIGLFNLDNLFRRLRLDFTDLTSKGTAFNSIDGSFTLNDGLITTARPTVIQLPATRVSFDGQVDLIRRTLDEQMNISLPVSEALPITALAVGAPEIGGILLLLHWAFGHWVDQVTEVHYAISGPWTQPTFRLVQSQRH